MLAGTTVLAGPQWPWLDPWPKEHREWCDRYKHESDIEVIAQMLAPIITDWYEIDLECNTDDYLSSWTAQSRSHLDNTMG